MKSRLGRLTAAITALHFATCALFLGAAKTGAQTADSLATAQLASLSERFTDASVDEVMALLDAGADTEALNKYQVTPLMMAASQGYTKIVEILLKADANVDFMADASGQTTSLHMAAQYKHATVVKQLLAAEANVNARATRQVTALHMAAEQGSTEIVGLLLDAGAEVDATEESGATALFIASQKGQIEVVRRLLAANANALAATKSGATPITTATERDHTDILALLTKTVDPDEVPGPLNPEGSLLTSEKGNMVEIHERLDSYLIAVNGSIITVAAKFLPFLEPTNYYWKYFEITSKTVLIDGKGRDVSLDTLTFEKGCPIYLWAKGTVCQRLELRPTQ